MFLSGSALSPRSFLPRLTCFSGGGGFLNIKYHFSFWTSILDCSLDIQWDTFYMPACFGPTIVLSSTVTYTPVHWGYQGSTVLVCIVDMLFKPFVEYNSHWASEADLVSFPHCVLSWCVWAPTSTSAKPEGDIGRFWHFAVSSGTCQFLISHGIGLDNGSKPPPANIFRSFS